MRVDTSERSRKCDCFPNMKDIDTSEVLTCNRIDSGDLATYQLDGKILEYIIQ
jgi:hypothetical protein